jgi:hypothetical protein
MPHRCVSIISIVATSRDQFYEARFRVIEAFERAGLYAYHVAEHHFTPLGMAPSRAFTWRLWRSAPNVCGSGRWSTRCRSMSAAADQEICMLDQISGGRLEILWPRRRRSKPATMISAPREVYEEGLALVLEKACARGAEF